jgi:hypothetical protein
MSTGTSYDIDCSGVKTGPRGAMAPPTLIIGGMAPQLLSIIACSYMYIKTKLTILI